MTEQNHPPLGVAVDHDVGRMRREETKPHATRQNRECEQAAQRLFWARKKMREALELEFPYGAKVRVKTAGENFTGKVVGWDPQAASVAVLDDSEGKVKRRWYRHVQTTPTAEATRAEGARSKR